jgi:DNA-binding response OmpR family regulator
MKILLVEDNRELLEQLTEFLRQQRYLVEGCERGDTALERLFEASFDLVVLDLMLPGLDGLSLLKEMRGGGIKTPVLLLTAKSSIDDRVEGLDAGADDYLAKPFSRAELAARIRALLRRPGRERETRLKADDLVLDTVTREVARGGRLLELTPKEFSLLEFLLYNRPQPVSRITLAEHVWGDDFDPFTMSNTIDVHIKNLRRKLDPEGHRQPLIITIRGIGFAIREA